MKEELINIVMKRKGREILQGTMTGRNLAEPLTEPIQDKYIEKPAYDYTFAPYWICMIRWME